MSGKACDGPSPVELLRELAEGYRHQLEGYRRWLNLAHQARARADDDELDEFLRLHGEKEDVARRLQEREEQLRARRETLRVRLQLEQFTLTELERARSRVDDPEAFGVTLAEFRELLTSLSAVMRDLEPVERDTENRLRRRLRALRGELTNVQSAKRATRAYNEPHPDDKEARFIDHKG